MSDQTKTCTRYLTLALCLWCSCSSDDRTPDFVTSNGVSFHLNGYAQTSLTKSQAEEYEEFAWQIYADRYGATPERHDTFFGCLKGAWVEVSSASDFDCGAFYDIFHPGDHCNGSYSGGAMNLATDVNCPYFQPYAHEIFHMVQWCDGKSIDLEHSDLIWTIYNLNKGDFMSQKCDNLENGDGASDAGTKPYTLVTGK